MEVKKYKVNQVNLDGETVRLLDLDTGLPEVWARIKQIHYTKDEVDKKIAEIDLSDYYTKEETDKCITEATENLATKGELKSYLPLAGGTLSGDLHIGGATIQASDGHIVLPSGVEIY